MVRFIKKLLKRSPKPEKAPVQAAAPKKSAKKPIKATPQKPIKAPVKPVKKAPAAKPPAVEKIKPAPEKPQFVEPEYVERIPEKPRVPGRVLTVEGWKRLMIRNESKKK